MSIFGKINKDTNTDTIPVIEGYDFDVDGDLYAAEEDFEDQLSLIEAMYNIDCSEIEYKKKVSELTESADVNALKSAKMEYEITTENFVKTAWEKIKAFVKSAAAKVVAYFNSAVAFFESFVKESKAFADKWEPELKKVNLEGFKYPLYDYNNSKISSFGVDTAMGVVIPMLTSSINTSASIEDLKSEIEELEKNKEVEAAEMRKAILGKEVSKDDFTKELMIEFRGSSKDKPDEQPVKIEELLTILKASTPMKNVKEFSSKLIEQYKKAVEAINKAEMDGEKSPERSGAYLQLTKLKVEALGMAKEVSLSGIKTWKQAIVERDNTYKRICVKALHYKKAETK